MDESSWKPFRITGYCAWLFEVKNLTLNQNNVLIMFHCEFHATFAERNDFCIQNIYFNISIAVYLVCYVMEHLDGHHSVHNRLVHKFSFYHVNSWHLIDAQFNLVLYKTWYFISYDSVIIITYENDKFLIFLY